MSATHEGNTDAVQFKPKDMHRIEALAAQLGVSVNDLMPRLINSGLEQEERRLREGGAAR